MKALVYEAPTVMNLRDLDTPEPRKGEVLVKVAYSGICGSELSGFLGQNSLRNPPLVFGHELSGTIAHIGDDVGSDLSVGARVTVNPLISCGQCNSCVSGRANLCPRRLLLGASLPGSNAEYVVVPAGVVETVPDGLCLKDAAMSEPAACAVHAVSLSGVRPGDTALVIGAGPIGLFLVQVLRAHGVRQVLVSERSQQRQSLAAGYGATMVPDAAVDLVEAVASLTGGMGAEVSFDAAGTESTRRNAIANTAPGGRAMLIGLHSDETSLSVNTAIRNEIGLQGVFAYTPAAFRTALSWLAERRLGLESGVVEAALADGPEWYERLVAGDSASKVLLCP